LIEGKILPGQYLAINKSLGYVESLTIRQITLRHCDGSIEYFPFSKINTIQNFSCGYNVVTSTFAIDPKTDMQKFSALAKSVFKSMVVDKRWGKYIIEEKHNPLNIEILSIGSLCINVVVRIKIKVDTTNSFANEYSFRMLNKLQQTNFLGKNLTHGDAVI
jgi:small-conductance mechanosensitive channel